MTNSEFINWLKGFIDGMEENTKPNSALKIIKAQLENVSEITHYKPIGDIPSYTMPVVYCHACTKGPGDLCKKTNCPQRKIVF